MTNAEKIRSLNDDELSAFLFKLSIKTLTGFMEAGGAGVMNAVDLRNFLDCEYSDDNFLLNGKPYED
jgi:hypothetical protein